MSERAKILLAGGLDAETERRLEARAEVVRPATLDEDGMCAAVGDCDGIIARTHVHLSRHVLAAGERLRVVGVAGVGVDRVDLEAAEELGVKVLHTPAASTEAVADFAIGLMIATQRSMPRVAAGYRGGEFSSLRKTTYGHELHTLTIGIVGMGRIGSRVGRICSAGFGATVIYNDIVEVGPFDFAATEVEKAAVWERSDIVTLHVPSTDLTRKLVNAEVLRRMKPGAILINAARGVVVDTEALVEALAGGQIAGAGLDVTDPEPLQADHPLFAMENCVLTPHVAARTAGGLQRMYAIADDVLAFLGAGRG